MVRTSIRIGGPKFDKNLWDLGRHPARRRWLRDETDYRLKPLRRAVTQPSRRPELVVKISQRVVVLFCQQRLWAPPLDVLTRPHVSSSPYIAPLRNNQALMGPQILIGRHLGRTRNGHS